MIEKLQELKKKSHMTNQQIAEKSNVPESTVARIFSGKTPNPTVTTVISMARAMGASPADLLSEEDGKNTEDHFGDHSESVKPDGTAENAAVESAEVFSTSELAAARSRHAEDAAMHEKIYGDMLALYKEEIRKKDIWISRLFWCLAGIVLFILFVLVFDILHPTFGFVKY